jgi:Grx4 family monothiol glutaredoxin
LFWAAWDQASEVLKSMMTEMPKAYKSVRLGYVDCDESDLVDTLDVETVQTVVVIHPEFTMKKPEKHIGVVPEKLTEVVKNEDNFYQKSYEEAKILAFRDIESQIGRAPFFCFIKGTQEEPKCKFTRRLVEMFGKFSYQYSTFNILKDERIRQWLKVYTSWPTYPQIFLNGKFVGGIDIVTELVENDEFDDMVPAASKPGTP